MGKAARLVISRRRGHGEPRRYGARWPIALSAQPFGGLKVAGSFKFSTVVGTPLPGRDPRTSTRNPCAHSVRRVALP